MSVPDVVCRDEWLAARRQFLAQAAGSRWDAIGVACDARGDLDPAAASGPPSPSPRHNKTEAKL
jgi:hypothetical protein